MHRRESSIASGWTALVGLVLPLLLAAPAAGQRSGPPLGLDHFRCYPILVGHPTAEVVELEDQFDVSLGRVEEVFVGLPRLFCNPVEKSHDTPGPPSPILDPDAHLVLYEIHERGARTSLADPSWRVSVENQFGRQPLLVRDPGLLAVPTHKLETGLEAPEDLDHFKCYHAKGRALNVVVTLDDQFETTTVAVVTPEVFCNPVEKTDASGAVTEIGNPDDHLVCYEIDLAQPLGLSQLLQIEIDNQFAIAPPQPLSLVTEEDLLCVPSRKRRAIGLPGAFKAP